MTRLQWESLVEYALDLARQMMECGAEAWRADNTLSRIFKAYGLEVLDVHTMATQTAATVKLPDGSHYTSTSMIQPEKTGEICPECGMREALEAFRRTKAESA